jgi:hypothetical protein
MKSIIAEHLQNAQDNGYPCWNEDPKHVAEDLLAYTDDFDELDFDAMVIVIREIQEERK